MANTPNNIKHVLSPLARQTLLDRDLTDPIAGVQSIRLLPWVQGCCTSANDWARGRALRENLYGAEERIEDTTAYSAGSMVTTRPLEVSCS